MQLSSPENSILVLELSNLLLFPIGTAWGWTIAEWEEFHPRLGGSGKSIAP